jgi:hypothetical protein
MSTIALITNKRVVNVVIGNVSAFSGYDYVIDITDLPVQPGINSYYSPINNTFSTTPTFVIFEKIDGDLVTLGTATSFSSFPTESFTVVSCGKFVAVGCMQFNVNLIKFSFTEMLIDRATQSGPFTCDGTNIYYLGSYSISVVDATTILSILNTLADEPELDAAS